jgi:N-acetylmuramoyl-L-alanine amidase|tara:strand:+ start:735 stop:1469 length:735 start_codon:yes stop_codon:yes gene_type:complete
MPLKTTINYSPNFDLKKRRKNRIRFLIFHYTGMKSEKKALERLIDIQSEVSSHYFVSKRGEVNILVPDLYVAWHAGISAWKSYKSLNKDSIGIEISNPGHEFGYEQFSKKQINTLVKLSKFLIKKYKIDKKNILGHSDIAPDRKMDPGEKFPWRYFASKKIGIWHGLDVKKLRKLREIDCTKIQQNKFLYNLKSIGYSFDFGNKTIKPRNIRFIIKAFQRRFRPELINGLIDQECLLISKKLVK